VIYEVFLHYAIDYRVSGLESVPGCGQLSATSAAMKDISSMSNPMRLCFDIGRLLHHQQSAAAATRIGSSPWLT
jgi:hypothetical protein